MGSAGEGGLRLCHVALMCEDLEACEDFYVRVLGLRVVWRPDPDNIYLSGGHDNLALHRGSRSSGGPLDHIGFAVDSPEAVDSWHKRLEGAGTPIAIGPKTHRDGSRSFYGRDPGGVLVQFIFLGPSPGPAVREAGS